MLILPDQPHFWQSMIPVVASRKLMSSRRIGVLHCGQTCALSNSFLSLQSWFIVSTGMDASAGDAYERNQRRTIVDGLIAQSPAPQFLRLAQDASAPGFARIGWRCNRDLQTP